MKILSLLLLPLFLGGCLTVDDVAALSSPTYGGRPTGAVPTGNLSSYYQNPYADGYRKGYNAGYYDGDAGRPFQQAMMDRRAPGAQNPFDEGYHRGYADGYRDARRLGYYNYQRR